MVFTRQDVTSLEDRDTFEHSRLPLYIQVKYSDDYVLARCCIDHQISDYVRETSGDQLLTDAIAKLESQVHSFTTHRRMRHVRQALITELIDGPRLLAMKSLGPPRMLAQSHTWSTRARLIGAGAFLVLIGAIISLALLLPGVGPSPSVPPTAKGQTAAVAQLLQRGEKAMSSGDPTGARTAYLEALKIDPLNAYAYYNLGVLYQQGNQPSVAATAYGDALLINANFPQALFNLAIIEAKSNPQESATLYERLVEVQPKNASALFNLGLVLAQLGDKKAGQQSLSKAVTLDAGLASRVPKDLLPLP